MNLFSGLDWIVLAIYFFILLGIIWWVVQQKQDSTEEYFLAGRNLGWFVIGASIFASNIGSEHIVGLAGTAANSGMVMGCLLYTSPSPRDRQKSRMPSSA